MAWAKLTHRGAVRERKACPAGVAHKLGFPRVSEGTGWKGQKMQLLPELSKEHSRFGGG